MVRVAVKFPAKFPIQWEQKVSDIITNDELGLPVGCPQCHSTKGLLTVRGRLRCYHCGWNLHKEPKGSTHIARRLDE